MREGRPFLLLVGALLMMFGFASTASAQLSFSVSSNPNEVVHYGITEVMGRIRLETTTGTSIGSTITITYQGVSITNASSVPTPIGTSAAGGILVQGTQAFGSESGITYTSVATTGTGGQVIISIPSEIEVFPSDFSHEITIDGVRADVSTKSVGTDIQGSLSSTPSTANTFAVPVLRVATINESLAVEVSGVTIPVGSTPASPTIQVAEGFAGAFVQYVQSQRGTGPPSDGRTPFGAVNNTFVFIALSSLPTGVTVTWPEFVGQGARLELFAQLVSGEDAVYEYTTNSQAVSDANVEAFVISPTVQVASNASPGQVTASVRLGLNPGALLNVPRFNHPFVPDPAANFVEILPPGPGCAYTLSPTSALFTGSGGTGRLTVTTDPEECEWSVDGVPSWITITQGNGGTGRGIVRYTVANNPSTSQRTATLTIAGQSFAVAQDGTPLATVTISATDPHASEGGLDRGGFAISRSGSVTGPLTVKYKISGSATNGVDFQALSGLVTVRQGSNQARIEISPFSDKLAEGDETVSLTLAPDDAYTVGSPDSATVTIADNVLPTVTISASDPNASEAGSDPGSFTVSRSSSSLGALKITYAVTGTATSGDYASLPGTVTIQPGSTTAIITLSPVNDTTVELDETVIVTLSANPAYTLGSPRSATVTITSDDIVSISIEDVPSTANPGTQPNPRIILPVPASFDITGTLTLSFKPDPSLGSPIETNPEIKFPNDGTTLDFTVPAGETEAVFSFQVGTVAGTITLTVNPDPESRGSVAPPAPSEVIVARSKPFIGNVTVPTRGRTTTSFEVALEMCNSSPRSLQSATFNFTPVAGKSLQGGNQSLSLSPEAGNWFESPQSKEIGSQFRMTVPFTLQAGGNTADIGSVSVTLTNSVGTSDPKHGDF